MKRREAAWGGERWMRRMDPGQLRCGMLEKNREEGEEEEEEG